MVYTYSQPLYPQVAYPHIQLITDGKDTGNKLWPCWPYSDFFLLYTKQHILTSSYTACTFH
jgi:hypothetical protein